MNVCDECYDDCDVMTVTIKDDDCDDNDYALQSYSPPQMFNVKKSFAEDSIHSKGITNRIQVLEKSVADNHAVAEDIAAKLPQLEQQKTDAVASRNYKVAGQLTSQIKQMQGQKENATVAEASAQEELNAIRASSKDQLAALDVGAAWRREA